MEHSVKQSVASLVGLNLEGDKMLQRERESVKLKCKSDHLGFTMTCILEMLPNDIECLSIFYHVNMIFTDNLSLAYTTLSDMTWLRCFFMRW